MSAVPKKKLCWNCEGNVSKEIDNCPYCGVYLHSMESEEENPWNFSYNSSPNDNNQDNIPAPPYQAPDLKLDPPGALEQQNFTHFLSGILPQIKKDIFPILFLMGGSLFFLFGTILFLFADQDGVLTLQWKRDHWIYFLATSLPAIYFGWKYLKIDSENEDHQAS